MTLSIESVCKDFDALMEAYRQEQIATAKTLARVQDTLDRTVVPINQENEE